ncbi:DNA-binding transcriptional LysR family regulator [Pseudomonas sp. JUb42]|jgi:DNA-binding transcriptional LysR family regulator|uniref:LysR family transcriptional regulator n=1 Tax=Pseudomonas sp. JUb42 TaxID=2940611 RepID=UPI002169AFC8|nr:LysR family transcriptional regulator [Pseudomonas sp. JUb42]MCS3468947.1 DNA-binding transcriptional LysR family regulator [Pseudomonas sp. JUb42]
MIPADSFQGVITFVMAARSTSFTEAAERLGVSKSAVGKAIARLEERLGTQLFHRTTRRISLTADGDAYFAACTSALEEIGSAESGLGPGGREPSGRLRVDMPVAFGRRVVAPLLFEIANKYPALQLNVTFSDHLVDPIEEGIDLLVRFGEIKDTSGLVARRLARQRWAICAAPDYLARFGTPHSLEDLQSHHCVVGYRRGQPLSWRVGNGAQSVRYTPPVSHQIGDGEAMILATVAGVGLCQMPRCLFRDDIEAGRLVEVLADFEPEPVEVHAVWPKVSHLRPKVRYVVDELVKVCEHWQ